MADNRPSVYHDPEIDSWVYRASSVGMCVKALVAISLNYEEALSKDTEDMLTRTAEEGVMHEGAVINSLVKDKGYTVVEEQSIVNVPIMPGVLVRGHTDGIIRKGVKGKLRLLEVKSMSTKRFARWQSQKFEGFPKYAYQLSAYMKAFPGMDVVYAVKRREDGLIALTDIKADNPPVPFSQVRKKVMVAEKYRRKNQLPPSCDIPPSEQFFCPLWYLHDEEAQPAGEVTEEIMGVLSDLIPKRIALSEIEKAGKEAERERKGLDKEIINLMGDEDKLVIPVEVDGEVVNFQMSRVNGSNTYLDTDQLREDLGDRYKEYEKVTKYKYVRVTEKKG